MGLANNTQGNKYLWFKNNLCNQQNWIQNTSKEPSSHRKIFGRRRHKDRHEGTDRAAVLSAHVLELFGLRNRNDSFYLIYYASLRSGQNGTRNGFVHIGTGVDEPFTGNCPKSSPTAFWNPLKWSTLVFYIP